jgi:hypothetical protein
MSEALTDCGISWNTHDPGVVLTHLAVAIADGADCLSDFEALREQSELFGDVASVSTAWRAVKATTSLREALESADPATEKAADLIKRAFGAASPWSPLWTSFPGLRP